MSVFSETTSVRLSIKQLAEFRSNDWKGFCGNRDSFAELQQKILPEINYLKDFWDDQTVNDRKFWSWNCMRSFDDIPERHLVYCNHSDHVCKYDVMHDRERYLGMLNDEIWSLFHDWQYVTQGWTAY